jgi:hypothetical protein
VKKNLKTKAFMRLKFTLSEPIIFYTVLILNMLPVLLFRFFPTMDGAAHLYNSNIINELVFHSSSKMTDYFVFNETIVPNWLGHFILAILNFFLPGFLTEKIFLLLYLFLLPYSFRNLTAQFSNVFLSYLIFPFCYTSLFYLGFYNLSISFILLFASILYWKKNEIQWSTKNLIVLFLLISLTYFAHIFIYSILLFTLFLMLSQAALRSFLSKKYTLQAIFSIYWKKYFALFLIALPTLILFFLFVKNVHFEGEEKRIANSELIRWIKDVRPLIALMGEEVRFTEIYYHLLIALSSIILFLDIQQIIAKKEKKSYFFHFLDKISKAKNIFLIIGILVLVLYFTVPDSASAGMMSERLCLLFFIYMVIWLSIQTFPKWLSKFSILIILIVNFGLLARYIKATKAYNSEATSIYEAANYIEPYSVVLPLNNSENWLDGHFSNYIGSDKPLIILENYEANTAWFPIKWNEKKLPSFNLNGSNFGLPTFVWQKTENKNTTQTIDYVLIRGNADKITAAQIEELGNFYDEVFKSTNGFVRLLKIKKQ